MQAGKLRSRITLQRRSTSQDEMGGPVETWEDLATVPAEIKQFGGSEQFKGGQFSPEGLKTVSLRYYPGITPVDRVSVVADDLEAERILDIVTVDDVNGRHRELILTCKERVLSTVTAG